VASLISVFDPLAARELPDWKTFNILDESLLRNTIRDGSLSKMTMRRLSQYVFSAVDGGASAIVVTCSSLGAAVEAVRPLCPVPLFRIDQGMAVEAVSKAKRIGVLATLSTTLQPTGDLLRATAIATRADCEISERLCEGAFERLSTGDREGHDALVVAGFQDLASKVDLVVLAQASMTHALASLSESERAIPVLSSPQLGMRYVGDQLSAS
jgi:Asp/Glu/hydantoin racemase